MSSALCTLFEGSYHHGVAALANSLHASGFRGTLYAGLRGGLPPWAAGAEVLALPPWRDARRLVVADGLRIVFLPLDTAYHLTNYKADFMLALLDGPARAATALFYLDPDICVLGPWRFFEQWVDCGVALCEDVNSPLPQQHPRRVGWRRHYAEQGLALRYAGPEYVNGGFVGVRTQDRAFIETWKRTMDGMLPAIGSLAAVGINAAAPMTHKGFADCFDRTDQDALNAAIEAGTVQVSIIGKEAMAFAPGPALLPHALGGHKPWQRAYLHFAFKGVPPRRADKAYWDCAGGPIHSHSAWRRRLKRLDLGLAAAFGRMLRKA